MTMTRTWLRQHPLVAYFGLAYAYSWLLSVPLAVAHQQGIVAPFGLHYFTAWGPLLAAFAVTWLTTGGGGVRKLLARTGAWRIGWLWWLVALSPLLVYGLVALGMGLFGNWLDFGLLGTVKFLPKLGLVALPLWLLTFGFGEETGWRGFALPHLQQHYNALTASLILGVLWLGWHIPFFFYIYDVATLPGVVLGLLAGTILLTWLYNSTAGSVLAVAVWHATFNYITASGAGVGLVAATLSTLVMVVAVLVVVIWRPEHLSHRQRQA